MVLVVAGTFVAPRQGNQSPVNPIFPAGEARLSPEVIVLVIGPSVPSIMDS